MGSHLLRLHQGDEFTVEAGRPDTIPQTEEGPGYGGAMLAMVGCGEYASVRDCAEALVRVTDSVAPDPALAAKYRERYAAFREIYPAMKPLFPKIV